MFLFIRPLLLWPKMINPYNFFQKKTLWLECKFNFINKWKTLFIYLFLNLSQSKLKLKFLYYFWLSPISKFLTFVSYFIIKSLENRKRYFCLKKETSCVYSSRAGTTVIFVTYFSKKRSNEELSFNFLS